MNNNTVLHIAQTKVTVTQLHIVKDWAGEVEDHTHVGVHLTNMKSSFSEIPQRTEVPVLGNAAREKSSIV